MIRYRVEIYDNAFTYKAHAAVSSKEINVDYMVLATSTVTTELLDAETGDYISIKADGSEIYTGIITAVETTGEYSKITFNSLMSLLDFQVYIDKSTIANTGIETYLAGILNGIYAGSDTYQKLTGFSATTDGTDTIVSIGSDESVLNLYDFALRLLRVGILFQFSMNIPSKTISCYITHLNTGSYKVIRAQDADVAECVIDVRYAESDVNKIKYINEDDTTQTLTYYLHMDGSIDTNSSTNRISPVIYEEKVVSPGSDTFADVSLADAESSMALSEYSNEIDVTFNAESKLLSVGQIGDIYQIISKDHTVYTSILTGFEEVNTKYLTMKFGFIRTDLTAVLKIQRRKK